MANRSQDDTFRLWVNSKECFFKLTGMTIVLTTNAKNASSQKGTSPTAAIPHAGQSFGTDSWNSTVKTIAASTATVLKMSQTLYAVNFFIRKAPHSNNSILH